MHALERENKHLSETLLDQQCCSMKNNLVFSGIAKEDSVDCETVVKIFMMGQLKLPSGKKCHLLPSSQNG